MNLDFFHVVCLCCLLIMLQMLGIVSVKTLFCGCVDLGKASYRPERLGSFRKHPVSGEKHSDLVELLGSGKVIRFW